MILSHRYKFVCLNPPKTGTGFRERLLSKYTDLSVLIGGRKQKKIRHWTSSQASKYIKDLNRDPNDYYWFTFVRNPWERMISWVNMDRNNLLEQKEIKNISVEESIASRMKFLHNKGFKNYIYRDSKLLNFIGSFENMTEDLNFVLNRLNIDVTVDTIKDVYIKDFKKEIRDKLSSRTIKTISEIEKEVIEIKKYTFNP